MWSMFVIELVYKADLAVIEAAMKEHVGWLNKHYASGTFVVSGRKIPRDGGIIIASGGERAASEAIVREDPFVARRLAEYRLIEFRESQRADDVPARIRWPCARTRRCADCPESGRDLDDVQLALFDRGERMRAVDRVRDRFGYDAVHLASTLAGDRRRRGVTIATVGCPPTAAVREAAP